MISIAVKDLKRPRELREVLAKEGEVLVTKDGRPFAIMVGIDPEVAEESVREIRRALFSSTVLRARRRAVANPLSEVEIAAEVEAVRARRRP